MNNNIVRKLNSLIRLEIKDIFSLRSKVTSILSTLIIEIKKLIPIVKL